MAIPRRFTLTALCVALAAPLFCGCGRATVEELLARHRAGGGKQGVKPPWGAASIEELLGRYRRAHDNKDIEDLRGILDWEPRIPDHKPWLEKPMIELFEMPLAEVRYLAGPPLQHKDGGQARYLIPREGKKPQDHGMIGPICGKIVLVEKTADGRQPRVLDPSYIVGPSQNFDGRYFIDILQPVAEDAARAFKMNTPQKVIPQPLEVINNPYRKQK